MSTATVTLVHPFIVDIIEPDHIWYGFWGEHPLARVEGDAERCALCGQKIAWRVVVSSEGRHYVIGRDCAVSISNMPQAAITHRSRLAQKRSKTAAELMDARAPLEGLAQSAELAKLPHPMRGSRRWAAGLTMVDYCRFWLDCKTAKPEDLRRAGKIAQEALSQHHADMDARAEAYLTARALNPASAEQMYSGFDADFRRHLEGLAVAAYERSHPAM